MLCQLKSFYLISAVTLTETTEEVIHNYLLVFHQILGSTNGVGPEQIVNTAVFENIIPPFIFLDLLIGHIIPVPNNLGPHHMIKIYLNKFGQRK